MVEIGGKPILWHIMKSYSTHGITDFVICLGYRGHVINEYSANFHLHSSDVSFDLLTGRMEVHRSAAEPWSVTLVDTGEATMTGGRIRRVLSYVDDDDFCTTYGDGLCGCVADNQTDLYQFGSDERRPVLSRYAWGPDGTAARP